MQKQILINSEPKEKRVAVIKEGRLEAYYVERPGYRQIVGNIYKGKVSAVVPGLAAAFVDIGYEKNGFLYAGDVASQDIEYFIERIDSSRLEIERTEVLIDIKKLLSKGQDILVQVEKEAIGTKGPRLTQYITLPGRYIVLMPLQSKIGISKRINGGVRQRIKKMLNGLRIPKGVGVIIRTAAAEASPKDIVRELKYLLRIWGRIRHLAECSTAPTLIYEEYDLILRIVRDQFTEDVDRLMVDKKEDYNRINKFLKMALPKYRSKVELYKGNVNIFDEYDIERQINKLYQKKVKLRSKGSIVIEQTESLVAIDVNTAGFTGRINPEETAFKTNLEAAYEIARQIKLRDLGGIIVIDFIDMELRENRIRVREALEEALKDDKAKTEVLGVSALGVVEMARERVSRSLESIVFQPCPYCSGRGVVKSVSTLSIEVFRRLKRELLMSKRREIQVVLHPAVGDYLMREDRSLLRYFERHYKAKIYISTDPAMHIEDIRFFHR